MFLGTSFHQEVNVYVTPTLTTFRATTSDLDG